MMSTPDVICRSKQRRHQIRKREDYNGLDYLEVVNETILKIYFLDKAPSQKLIKKENIRITGGRRIRNIQVVGLDVCSQPDPQLDDCMLVKIDKPGDFSTYTLCLVALDDDGRPTDEPFPGFDPRYACLDFNFKVDCPSDMDCKREEICSPQQYPEPEINYLTKDYATFRQLILDRLALTMPDWQERHVPDIGVALAEVLAYTGDYLSYYQDAVATEAYLDTARQRISVRRHARLVDYQMHEGCNARTWVHLNTDTDTVLEQIEKISLITDHDDIPSVGDRLLTWDDLVGIPSNQYEVFEPLIENAADPIRLYQAHNEIQIYTWGDQECCLPQDSTTATLKDGIGIVQPVDPEADDTSETPTEIIYERKLHLKKGDILIFEEIIGPKTGNSADADPARRHAVCLTKVEELIDDLYHQPVLEITWAEEDALPFPFCISVLGPAPECALINNISVVRGNVILVDHGHRIPCEKLGSVPAKETVIECEGVGRPSEIMKIAGRFRPQLKQAPVTFNQPLFSNAPAASLLAQDPRQALPWIKLSSAPGLDCQPDQSEAETLSEPPVESTESPNNNDSSAAAQSAQPDTSAEAGLGEAANASHVTTWEARRDLLGSSAHDYHFVVEIDDAGQANLRFSDDDLGRRPDAGAAFTTTYRIGNGLAGNVGAEAISHVVTHELISGINLQPRNPLPAQGGIDPEPKEEVKLFAPHAFRRQIQRAIIPQDYADIVKRDFAGKIQRAAAVLRWTGSWYEVMVVVDPRGQVEAAQELLDAIEVHLHRYRRIGHDLVVKPARYVPLDIELNVCVLPDYLRGHVKAALQARFSNRILPDGQPGFFHPDNLTFGEGIYLSDLVATAQAVTGVASVTVEKLERLYEGPNNEIEDGILKLAPLEIARLDNDPNFPENGRLNLIMRGGR